MTDNEKIKKLLKYYRQLKSEIETELTKEYPEFSLDSVSFIETSGNQRYSKTSQQERYILKKYDIPVEVQKKIKIRNIIESAYESLTEDYQKIVKYRYFERKSYRNTGKKVYMHRTTISRKIKEDIFPKLKKAGILKAWELWKEGEV